MNKLYFVVSRLALGCIMASVITAASIQYMSYATTIVPRLTVFLMALVFSLMGYFLKSLIAAMFSTLLPDEPKKGIMAFFTGYFVPIAVIALLTYAFGFIPENILDLLRTDNSELFSIQRQSFNFSMSLHFCLSLFVGMIIWRSDADSYYAEPITLLVSLGGIGISYGLSIFENLFANPELWYSETFSTLLLVVIASYAVLTSQVCIVDLRSSIRDFSSDKNETRALLYNYVMLLFMLPLFLLLFGLSWLCVNGVYVIIRFAIYAVFKNPAIPLLGVGIYGVIDVLSAFTLLIVAVALILRVRVTKLLDSIAHFATSLWGMLIDKFLSGLKGLKNDIAAMLSKDTSDEEDEEIKHQDALINEYIFPEPTGFSKDTFEAFLRRLQRLPDLDRQIGYAYRKICEMYRADGAKIKESDTPREVAKKLTKVSEGERENVVRLIERVKFSSDPLTDEEKDQILADLCRIIRRQYI